MYLKAYNEYWNAIATECDLALEAVGKLNFAVLGLYRNLPGQAQYWFLQDEVFQAIGGLLTSAGNLSCLIWPEEGGKTGQINIMSDTENMEAAKWLRHRLHIDKRHILHKKWLKDCFAEKMEASKQIPHQEMVFHIVGAYLPFSGHFMPTIAFLYDPISRKFQYGGETLDIQEIAAAIYSMKRSLQDKIRETSSCRLILNDARRATTQTVN